MFYLIQNEFHPYHYVIMSSCLILKFLFLTSNNPANAGCHIPDLYIKAMTLIYTYNQNFLTTVNSNTSTSIILNIS